MASSNNTALSRQMSLPDPIVGGSANKKNHQTKYVSYSMAFLNRIGDRLSHTIIENLMETRLKFSVAVNSHSKRLGIVEVIKLFNSGGASINDGDYKKLEKQLLTHFLEVWPLFSHQVRENMQAFKKVKMKSISLMKEDALAETLQKLPTPVQASWVLMSLPNEQMAEVIPKMSVEFWKSCIDCMASEIKIKPEEVKRLDDHFMWDVRINRFVASDPTMSFNSMMEILSQEEPIFASKIVERIREKNEFLCKKLEDKWVTLFDLDRLGDKELRSFYREIKPDKWVTALRWDDPEMLDRIQTLLTEEQRLEFDQLLQTEKEPDRPNIDRVRMEIISRIIKKGELDSKFNLAQQKPVK